MTISFERLWIAHAMKTTNQAASIAALFFYFAYAPCYNLGNNALTYSKLCPSVSIELPHLVPILNTLPPAYLIELFPYAERTRGIGIQQIFGKIGAFFSNNVNPVALNAINWKFLAIYCGWIFFEFIFIYFVYPETSGRTLEELSFLFEDKALAEQAVESVEKVVHNDDAMEMDPDLKKAGVVRVESVQPKELY